MHYNPAAMLVTGVEFTFLAVKSLDIMSDSTRCIMHYSAHLLHARHFVKAEKHCVCYAAYCTELLR